MQVLLMDPLLLHHHETTTTTTRTITEEAMVASSSSSSSCFSLISLYGGYLRNTFISSGLSPQTIQIDPQTTLHCWAPNPSSSSKPNLVLIHGFGPSPLWQWRNQVQALSARFNIYVPDLIFFGESTTTSSERSEVFQAVSVGKLLEKLGVERFSVMGTSYGGFVSYHLARMFPERVEKVVIASSAVNMRRNDNGDLLERAKAQKIEDLMLPTTAAQLRTLLQLVLFKPPRILPDFLLNDFLSKLYSENREEKIELLKGITLGRDDAEQISPLTQEVLIIWGEHDKIFPLDKAYDLMELLGNKQVRMEVINKTSHTPQIEEPKRFNEMVEKFLSGSTSSL